MHLIRSKKKIKNKRILEISFLSSLILILFLIQIINLGPLSSSAPPINDNQNITNFNEKLDNAAADSILLQGTEEPLNITELGNLYNNSQEITLNNDEVINLTYYLDDFHNWKVSKIENSIENIQDTRNWINNSDFESFNVSVYKVDEPLTNDRTQTQPPPPLYWEYDLNSNKATSGKNITKEGAIAIRAHFLNISTEDDYDYVMVEDENNNLCYQDTGNKTTPFYSPWVKGDTLQIYINSDESVNDYGYYIDHYQYINGSFDYFFSNPWDFNEVSSTDTYYGYGKIDNATAMYVGLLAEQYAESALYYEDDFAEIYQSLTVPRGRVIDASISFDYYGEFAIESNDFYIYTEINKQKIYSVGLRDLVESGRNQWHKTGKINIDLWVNQSNIFDSTINDQEINFSIGIKSGGEILFGGFEDRYQQVIWFDNITLSLTTNANSTQEGIDLKIYGDNLDAGNEWGQASQIISSNIWEENPVILNVSTTASELYFELDTTLYGFHNTTTKFNRDYDEGVSYTILENGSVYWEFLHDFAKIDHYSDFEFTIYNLREEV